MSQIKYNSTVVSLRRGALRTSTRITTETQADISISWTNKETSGTIVYTLSANAAIETGTFLDGSPWVKECSGLRLTNVTPSQDVLTSSSGSSVGQDFHIHNTIINPDFGILKMDTTSGTWSAYSTKAYGGNPSGTLLGEDTPTRCVPLDGRVGCFNDNGSYDVANNYYSDQRWDEQPTTLEAGDQVVKVVSRVSGTEGNWDNGIGLHGADGNEPLMHWIGVLTVLSASDAAVANTRFRPPIVWDISQKASRPLFEDNGLGWSFNGLPSTDLFGDSADYSSFSSLTHKESWFDNNKNAVLVYPALISDVPAKGTDSSLRDTRNCVSLGVSDHIYGLSVAKHLEAMSLALFDSSIALEIRDEIRRVFTQRGIDVYGAFKGGRILFPTGGHGTAFTPYLGLAAAVTQHADMLGVLNYSVGSATTAIGVSNELNPDDIPGGEMRFFDRRGRDLSSPLSSWSHHRRVNVPISSQGTETIDGNSYRWLILGGVEDMGVTAGFGGGGYLGEFHNFLNPSNQTLEQKIYQRVTPTDNSDPADIRNDTLNGLVVKGSGGTTRVFKTRVVDIGGNDAPVAGVNTPHRDGWYYKIWLCDDITVGVDTSVDCSPYCQEDLNADRAFADATGDTLESEWLFGAHLGPYDTNPNSCPILWGAIKLSSDADGWTLPAELAFRYRKMKARMNWSPGLWSFYNGRNPIYAFNDQSNSTVAWMTSRLPDAYGTSGSEKHLPYWTTSVGIARWMDGAASPTWVSIPSHSITDISWITRLGSIGENNYGSSDSSTTNTISTRFVASSGSTTSANSATCQYIYIRPDSNGRDPFLQTAFNGSNWSTANLKKLYLWPVGFNSPIICEPHAVNSASGDRAWYKLPADSTWNGLVGSFYGVRNMNVFFGLGS